MRPNTAPAVAGPVLHRYEVKSILENFIYILNSKIKKLYSARFDFLPCTPVIYLAGGITEPHRYFSLYRSVRFFGDRCLPRYRGAFVKFTKTTLCSATTDLTHKMLPRETLVLSVCIILVFFFPIRSTPLKNMNSNRHINRIFQKLSLQTLQRTYLVI